jgi:O-antigen ligase
MFSEKKLLTFIHYCLYAALATPLVYSSLFLYPAIFPKNIFFRFVVTLALVGYALLVYKDKKWLPPVNAVTISLAAFVVWTFIASALNSGFGFSFTDGFERMEGLLNYSYLAVYFVIAASILKSKSEWLTLLRWALSVSTLVAIYALLQVFNFSWLIALEGERVTGTLGNAGFLAGYLLLGIFLTLYLLHNFSRRSVKILYGVAIVVQAVALYFTQTRGAFLGLLAGILVYAVGSAIVQQGKRKIVIISLLGIMLIALVSAGIVYRGSIANAFTHDVTIRNRLLLWEVSWPAILAKPVFGWGAGNFDVAFNTHYNPQLSEFFFDHAHNTILDIVVRFGLFGVVLYLAFIVSMLWGVWRLRSITLLALLAGWFVHNLFLFDSISTFVIIFIIAAYTAAQLPEKNIFVLPYRYAKPAVALIVVLFLGAVWVYGVQPARASYAAAQALENQSTDPYASARYFQTAAAFGGLGKDDIAKRLAEATTAAAADPRYNVLTRNQLFSLAEAANQQLSAAYPQKLRYRLNLASLYLYAGNNDLALLKKAEDLLWQARNFFPNKIEIHDLLSQVYIRQKRWGDAANEIGATLALNDILSETHFLQGMVEIYLHNADTAAAAFATAAEQGREFTFSDYVTIGRAYEVNDYRKEAIAAFETARVTEDRRTTAGIDFVNRALYELYTEVGDMEKAEIYKQKTGL